MMTKMRYTNLDDIIFYYLNLFYYSIYYILLFEFKLESG